MDEGFGEEKQFGHEDVASGLTVWSQNLSPSLLDSKASLLCHLVLLVASDRKPNPHLIKQVGEFMNSLLALLLSYLVARWKEHCSHISRPGGKKACPRSGIPRKSLLVSHGLCMGQMSIPAPVTGSRLRDCGALTGVGLGPSSTPQHTGWEAGRWGGHRGWLSRGHRGIISTRRECIYWRQNFKCLNMASFHHFLLPSKSPRKPTSFPQQHFSD